MHVPSLLDVKTILEPHEGRLRRIALGGWGDWIASPFVSTWRTKRTRAGFVWEQMVARALVEFDGISNVRILDKHQSFSFLVDDKILFRLKKANRSGLSSNYPTQMALDFNEQLPLPGLPDVARVEVVYVLNTLETEIDDVLVVCRNGSWVAWKYSLLDRAEDMGSIPVDLPLAPPPPAGQLVRPRGEPLPKEQDSRE